MKARAWLLRVFFAVTLGQLPLSSGSFFMQSIEKTEKKTSSKKNGGARPGAGRKKGGMNKKTLEKKQVEAAMERRIMGVVDNLLDAQLSLARGTSHLFKKQEYGRGKDKRVEFVQVDNPEEIRDYLNGCFDDDPDAYYFITTKRPDNKAIDSMMDRVFGRAKQKIVGGDADDQPLTIKIIGAQHGYKVGK